MSVQETLDHLKSRLLHPKILPTAPTPPHPRSDIPFTYTKNQLIAANQMITARQREGEDPRSIALARTYTNSVLRPLARLQAGEITPHLYRKQLDRAKTKLVDLLRQ